MSVEAASPALVPEGTSARPLSLLLGVATLLGTLILCAISWHRAFQVDEVETIHAAYNVASGKLIYRDFWQGHHPLLYWLLGAVLPVDAPAAAFHLSRGLALLVLGTTVALSARVTARLGGLPLLTASVLLLHTTFVERGMEVRPDGLMTLLVVAALSVGTSSAGSPRRRGVIQGVLLGVAFLVTQKAAIASFAFGCVWLYEAMRSRDPLRVLLPCLFWGIPFAAMLAGLGLAGGLDEYVRYNLSHPVESMEGSAGASAARFSALGPILVEGTRNIAFMIAGLAALLSCAVGLRARPAVGPVVVLAVVWGLGLFVMPFPYPYSHVGGLPALAILLGVWLPRIASRDAGKAKGEDAGEAESSGSVRADARVALVLAAFLCAVMLTSVPRLLRETTRDNAYQLHLLERVQALTEPGDRVFDLAGLYFRDDAYPVYLMTGAHFVRYQQGDYPPIAAWLREHGLDLFVVNYRLKWLTGADRAFLQSHFVRVEPNLFLSGSDLDGLPPGAAKTFEVTRAGEYRFDGAGALLVDGVSFVRGRLERGSYSLETPSGIERGRLVRANAPGFRSGEMRDARVFHAFD